MPEHQMCELTLYESNLNGVVDWKPAIVQDDLKVKASSYSKTRRKSRVKLSKDRLAKQELK